MTPKHFKSTDWSLDWCHVKGCKRCGTGCPDWLDTSCSSYVESCNVVVAGSWLIGFNRFNLAGDCYLGASAVIWVHVAKIGVVCRWTVTPDHFNQSYRFLTRGYAGCLIEAQSERAHTDDRGCRSDWLGVFEIYIRKWSSRRCEGISVCFCIAPSQLTRCCNKNREYDEKLAHIK